MNPGDSGTDKKAASPEKEGGGAGSSFDKRLSLISLVASLLAIVLSQFHPLYTFIDKPKLAGSVNPEFTVAHYLGNLNLTLYLHLTNTGRATGTVSRVETFLEKADNTGYRKRMPVQQYFTLPTALNYGESPTQFPFGPRDLVPDGRWESYVVASELFSKDLQNQANAIVRKTQESITAISALAVKPAGTGPYVPTSVDSDTYAEITRFVHKNLGGFGLGEYNLLVLFWDEKSEKPFSVQCYAFSVFEGDVEALENITREYKTGGGLIYPFRDPNSTVFGSTLRPVKDDRTIERMLKDYEQM